MAFGTATKALTTTASALANNPCSQVVVFNDDAAIVIKVGNAAAQNVSVQVGSSSSVIRVRNTNQVYVKSASGTPTCSYHWS